MSARLTPRLMLHDRRPGIHSSPYPLLIILFWGEWEYLMKIDIIFRISGLTYTYSYLYMIAIFSTSVHLCYATDIFIFISVSTADTIPVRVHLCCGSQGKPLSGNIQFIQDDILGVRTGQNASFFMSGAHCLHVQSYLSCLECTPCTVLVQLG